MFTNADQQKIWNGEHKSPQVLLQMDKQKPSSGVVKFFDEFLKDLDLRDVRGLEMACGKGRSAIFLAEQGVSMSGFDFSPHAIQVAQERSADLSNTSFQVADATQNWPFEDGQFDFIVDCFGSTDIVSEEGRIFAYQEAKRVLKKDGFIMLYLLSPEDEFHDMMIQDGKTGSEQGSFHHGENNKFEKVFTEPEIDMLLQEFTIIAKERVEKVATFHDKKYQCYHWWIVAKKP